MWRLTSWRLPVKLTASYVHMYISMTVSFRCLVIAKRREDGLGTLFQTADRAALLRVEGITLENSQRLSSRKTQKSQEDWLDHYFQVYGALNSILPARKRWTLQAHVRCTGQQNGQWYYSYSTGETAKRCRPRCLKKYHYSSVEDSRLDISWQQILPDDPDAESKKKGSYGYVTTNTTYLGPVVHFSLHSSSFFDWFSSSLSVCLFFCFLNNKSTVACVLWNGYIFSLGSGDV